MLCYIMFLLFSLVTLRRASTVMRQVGGSGRKGQKVVASVVADFSLSSRLSASRYHVEKLRCKKR